MISVVLVSVLETVDKMQLKILDEQINILSFYPVSHHLFKCII